MDIFILIIGLAILCAIHFTIHRKILKPGFLFNFIWLVTLILYEMKLSYIQQDLSNKTVMIFYVCVIAFNVAVLIPELVNLKAIRFKFKKIHAKYSIEKKLRIAKYAAIGIFVIEIFYSGGVPLIWKFLGNGKTYFDFGIPSVNGALYGLIVCLGAYSIFTKSKDKYIYILMGVLVLSRQVLISMLIEAIVYAAYSGRLKVTIKRAGVIVIAVVLGFTILGNFRSGSEIMDSVFRPKEEYNSLPSSVKWIYSYMTFSISNFNNLVSMTEGGVNHGASIASDVMPTVLVRHIKFEPEFKSNYLVSPSYNVSTYLPNLYLDFGVIGIAIFNVLIGLLGYQLDKRAREVKSDKDSMLCAVYMHNIVLLFFVNMFLYLPIAIQFVYIIILFSGKHERVAKIAAKKVDLKDEKENSR